jgi:hypothetical protein
MKQILVLAMLLVVSAIATAQTGNKRAQLADQSREGVTNIARTITIVNWIGHINDALAKAPAGAALGQAWNPSEPRWDKAVDELMDAVMHRFDELKSAPEAFTRLAAPFQTNLTESEAAEVLALTASERKDVDAYADNIALAVNLMQRRSDLKIGTPQYKESLARLVKMANLPAVTDKPKSALAAKTLDDYQRCRMSSIDFMRTAMDGQLQLYWFDHSPAITAVITKAANVAGKDSTHAH